MVTKKHDVCTIGRRKESVARAYFYSGKGQIRAMCYERLYLQLITVNILHLPKDFGTDNRSTRLPFEQDPFQI